MSDHEKIIAALDQQKKYLEYRSLYNKGKQVETGLPGNFSGLRVLDFNFNDLNLTDANFSNTSFRNCKFRRSNLQLANFYQSNLENCDLSDSLCTHINFQYSKVYNCFFHGANLCGAIFSHSQIINCFLQRSSLFTTNFFASKLMNSNFINANMNLAIFDNANLLKAKLGSPTSMLLAKWGKLSKELCQKAMAFDAANHHELSAFDRWVKDETCPYSGLNYQRVCNFYEQPEFWDPTIKPPSALELMIALIKEKCADSDWH